MAQFDVYENVNEASKVDFPYMLDVQHSLHERIDTRMIIPLTQKLSPVRGLYISLDIEGEKYVAVVPEMVGMTKLSLGKKVANLSENSREIVNAIDFLITGF